MATRNAVAGHNYEREVAIRFRSTGFFPDVVTSRLASRLKDSQKIDLTNGNEDLYGRLPYNVQTKTIVNQPNYQLELAKLPRRDDLINVFLHKKTERREIANGKKRFYTVGNYAFLTEDDFFKMVIDRERYRVAFNMIHEYIDCIPDEYKIKIFKELEELGL